MENLEIPNGSKIKKKTSERGDVTLYWDRSDGGISRYFIGLFLMAWMGGWFFGFKNTLLQLINKPDAPNNGFLMFWLAGWTVGGCFAFYYLFMIFRPQKPEKITFHSNYLEYDTGTSAPTTAMFNRTYSYNPAAQWSKFFQKRKVFQNLQKAEIKFMHEKNPSRVYFDFESKRYEVGNGLTEPDVDWLYSRLSSWSK